MRNPSLSITWAPHIVGLVLICKNILHPKSISPNISLGLNGMDDIVSSRFIYFMDVSCSHYCNAHDRLL